MFIFEHVYIREDEKTNQFLSWLAFKPSPFQKYEAHLWEIMGSASSRAILSSKKYKVFSKLKNMRKCTLHVKIIHEAYFPALFMLYGLTYIPRNYHMLVYRYVLNLIWNTCLHERLYTCSNNLSKETIKYESIAECRFPCSKKGLFLNTNGIHFVMHLFITLFWACFVLGLMHCLPLKFFILSF